MDVSRRSFLIPARFLMKLLCCSVLTQFIPCWGWAKKTKNHLIYYVICIYIFIFMNKLSECFSNFVYGATNHKLFGLSLRSANEVLKYVFYVLDNLIFFL